jgi:hypothetical protein
MQEGVQQRLWLPKRLTLKEVESDVATVMALAKPLFGAAASFL